MGGCAQKKELPMSSAITKAPFGQTEAGQPIELYTLKNASGMEAGIINLGGSDSTNSLITRSRTRTSARSSGATAIASPKGASR
jgi:hypothetical protein